MNNVNKTLYIPLYGKAYVSKKGLFIKDKKAEHIWEKEQFPLKGKAKSKWLAYYMGIRAAVFDTWVKEQLDYMEDPIVIHVGCGMDSRVLRVNLPNIQWFDVDFPEVLKKRKRYFEETDTYHMVDGDIRHTDWLEQIPKGKNAILVMEGVSMYLNREELKALLHNLENHLGQIKLLMDCYTEVAAKMSKYKNPIHEVGVSEVYGLDDPTVLEGEGVAFIKEHSMMPDRYIDELAGFEKTIFRKVYAGKVSEKMYRLYEFAGGQK